MGADLRVPISQNKRHRGCDLMRLAPDRHATPLEPPRTASDRQRDYRRRLRKGEVVVSVPISHSILGLLLDLGWIEPELSEDRRAVAGAIRRVLTEAARHGLDDGRLPECGRRDGQR